MQLSPSRELPSDIATLVISVSYSADVSTFEATSAAFLNVNIRCSFSPGVQGEGVLLTLFLVLAALLNPCNQSLTELSLKSFGPWMHARLLKYIAESTALYYAKLCHI